MFQYKLRKCPLDIDGIRPFLSHLSAKGHIDNRGSLVLTFNENLSEHKASEHVMLLREYIQSLKQTDTPYKLIDTEEIDDRFEDYSERSDLGFKLETFGAFGSGIHDTTGGCMELITLFCTENDRSLHSVRALDIGTGTGILSLFSYDQGIRHVTSVDISLRAVIAALHNFRLNNIADSITLKQGSIADIDGRFELVIANIFISAIEEIFDDIFRSTVRGGTIIISGIKSAEEHSLYSILDKYPSLTVKKKLVRGEWLCIYLYKNET
jgi:ribosomal protein L11 methyltransferase